MHEMEQGRLVGADRVLAVLKQLAGHREPVSLDVLTREIGSPKPTVHRALATLRMAGLANQDGLGRYVLGDEFVRLAFAHHEGRPEHIRVQPILEDLASRFGETTHFAVLSERDVVYRAKVDPPVGALRLSSIIGGRNPAHATGVGKLLLAEALTTLESVRRWIGDQPLERRTPNTRCEAKRLHHDLMEIRRTGFATDDEENEFGVCCIAVPVFLTSPTRASGAISISALSHRTPLATLIDAVDEVRSIASRARAAA